jgi:transcriptional regulator with XRE-family HTH domain
VKVGEKIRTIRELKGIKQETLATLLGISQTAYSKIERNESDISLTRLSQIAEQLGVKEEDILTLDPTAIFNNSIVHSYNNNSGTFYNHPLSDKERELYEKEKELYEKTILAMEDRIKHLEEKLKSNHFQ